MTPERGATCRVPVDLLPLVPRVALPHIAGGRLCWLPPPWGSPERPAPWAGTTLTPSPGVVGCVTDRHKRGGSERWTRPLLASLGRPEPGQGGPSRRPSRSGHPTSLSGLPAAAATPESWPRGLISASVSMSAPLRPDTGRAERAPRLQAGMMPSPDGHTRESSLPERGGRDFWGDAPQPAAPRAARLVRGPLRSPRQQPAAQDVRRNRGHLPPGSELGSRHPSSAFHKPRRSTARRPGAPLPPGPHPGRIVGPGPQIRGSPPAPHRGGETHEVIRPCLLDILRGRPACALAPPCPASRPVSLEPGSSSSSLSTFLVQCWLLPCPGHPPSLKRHPHARPP